MMNLKNQRPVLVPDNLVSEIEQLSKAALIDMVWSLSTRLSGQEEDPGLIMGELRRERHAVLASRKASAGAPQ